MKRTPLRCAGLILAGALVMDNGLAIEAVGAESAPARAASYASSQSGTVTAIDARSGVLVLDGTRRFTFTPGGGLSVRRQNGSAGKIAEVKAGTIVKLTLIKSAGDSSAQVTELSIVH